MRRRLKIISIISFIILWFMVVAAQSDLWGSCVDLVSSWFECEPGCWDYFSYCEERAWGHQF